MLSLCLCRDQHLYACASTHTCSYISREVHITLWCRVWELSLFVTSLQWRTQRYKSVIITTVIQPRSNSYMKWSFSMRQDVCRDIVQVNKSIPPKRFNIQLNGHALFRNDSQVPHSVTGGHSDAIHIHQVCIFCALILWAMFFNLTHKTGL